MSDTRRLLRLTSHRYPALLGLLALTFFLRLPAFFKSVIDWDESLYLLMARSIQEGHLPYTALWDHKPPGIYYILALAFRVIGDSVRSMRILACVVIALNCLLLYRCATRLFRQGHSIGFIAGCLYILHTLDNGGLATNTEIFLIPVVTGALLLFLAGSDSSIRSLQRLGFFSSGLMMGIAMIIKYVALFDLVALMAIVVVFDRRDIREKWRPAAGDILQAIFLLALGSSVVVLATGAYFWAQSQLGTFVDTNFLANARHVGTREHSVALLTAVAERQIVTNTLLWLPLLAIPFLVRSTKTRAGELGTILMLLLWSAIDLAGIVAAGPAYGHYFLQLLSPTCLLSAFALMRAVTMAAAWKRGAGALVTAAAVVVALGHATVFSLGMGAQIAYERLYEGIAYWGDTPAEVSAYLRPRLSKTDYVYVADYEPIIYYLSDAHVPTRYAFPPFLLDPHFAGVAQIVPEQELEAILQKKPAYVVMRDRPHGAGFVGQIQRRIDEDYVLDARFDDATFNNFTRVGDPVKVYRRR